MPEITLIDKIKEEFEILERHFQILNIVRRDSPIGIIKLSEMTNFPQHKVRYSLRILEEEGIIKPSPNGAIPTEKTEEFINEFANILDELSQRIEKLKKLVEPR